jgi:hypothetical protein
MANKLTLHLSDTEFNALQHMACSDLRDLNKQVRWLVLDAAQKRGLLNIPTAERDHRLIVNAVSGQLASTPA